VAIKLECKVCGAGFSVKDCRAMTAKYCTDGCRFKGRVTHGGSYSKVYRAWQQMIQRCTNSNTKQFGDYGGRGITVCEEWRNSFTAFHSWALANGYKEGLEIDRERVNEGYCPENCRWVTHQQNMMNQRARSGCLSPLRGVTKEGRRWSAKIQANGKAHWLGAFDTQEEAGRAYDAASLKHHGKFGHRNFPEVKAA
jgi:hypothetical protein